MRSKTFLFSFACWLIAYSAAASKSYTILHYQDQKGLEATNIYGITQDKEGYIWLGSNQGMYRYDGNHFRLYARKEGIYSRMITRIYHQPDGSLLLVGKYPLAIYRMKDGKIKELKWEGLRYTDGRSVAQGRFMNKRYFLNAPGKEFCSIQGDTFQIEARVDLLGSDQYFQIKNRGVFQTGNRYKGIKQLQDTVFQPVFQDVFETQTVFSMTNSEDGTLWVLSEQGLYKEQPNGSWKRIMDHGLPVGRKIIQMELGGNSKIWLLDVYGEVWALDTHKKSALKVNAELGIEHVQVTYLFNDRSNNLWISTQGQGVYCIVDGEFVSYTTHDGLSGNYIANLKMHPNGTLYIGTNMGVSCLTEKTDVITVEPKTTKGYVTGISILDNGKVLYGGYRTASTNDLLMMRRFSDGYQLKDGRLVVCSWAKLRIMHLNQPSKNKVIKHFDSGCRKIIKHDGFLWVMTDMGVYKTLDLKQWEKIDLPFNKAQHTKDRVTISDMLFNTRSELWLATSNGVYYYNEEWVHLGAENNLSSARCRSLACDQEGQMWIGTDKGLNVWAGVSFLVYTKAQGLPSDQVNALTYDSLKNNLWIGTARGLSSIDLSQLRRRNEYDYPLFIDKVEIPGDTLIIRPENIALESNQRRLRIYFSCLNYNNPNEVSFLYRLNGGEWSRSNQSWVEYQSLAPGTYTFEVQSSVYESTFNPPIQMHFTIAVPFWQHRWVQLVTFLGLLALIYLWASIKIRKVRKEEAQKRAYQARVNQLERQALHSSMNPHFVFNALNSIQHYVAKYKDVKAIDYVAEFARLIRGNMEVTLGTQVTLKLEIEQLQRYINIENNRLDGRLKSKIEIDEHIELEQIKIPTLLIQPFVENAIWHGIMPKKGAGHIVLRFYKSAHQMLCIEIEDDGVGLNQSKSASTSEHVSRGIRLIKKRLLLLSAQNTIHMEELKNQHGEPSGTLVQLKIQLGRM